MIEAIIIFIRIFQGLLIVLGLFLFVFSVSLVFYIITRPVPWVPTKKEESKHMLNMAGLKKGERVLDLGCGDGRVLITAATEFGASGIGYDINHSLLFLGWLRSVKARCRKQVKLRRGDIFKVDIPKADVVVLYLFTEINNKIISRLREVLPKGTRAVTRAFPIESMEPETTSVYNDETYYLYEL